jgi:type II secretory pathway pseudopilin PulG
MVDVGEEKRRMFRRCGHPPCAEAGGPRDDGFSLAEVLISLAVVIVVAAAVGTFFITGLGHTRHQGLQQAAAQLALGAVEEARSLRGSMVVAGRQRCDGSTCVAFPAKAQPYLAGTNRYDQPDGTPTLEIINAVPIVLDGRSYRRHISVGLCYRATAGATCEATVAPAAFYRIVVAVTWEDQGCPDVCTHTTAALLSANANDPTFENS